MSATGPATRRALNVLQECRLQPALPNPGGVMKSSLLISITALTMACGASPQQRPDSSAPPTAAGSQPNVTNASGATSPGVSKARVTLVGCLQGPSAPGVTGTAGSGAGDRARARAAGTDDTMQR